MNKILGICAALVLVALAIGQCTNNAADIEQARAAVELARAAGKSAEAANTAAGGLALVAGGQTAILLLLVTGLVATWLGIGYVVLRRATRPHQQPGGRQLPALPQRHGQGPAIDPGQLVQVMLMQTLLDMSDRRRQRDASWAPMVAPLELGDGGDDEGELW